MTTRKQYSSKFKARVAIEVIRGERTLNQLASQFRVRPVQIVHWRRTARMVVWLGEQGYAVNRKRTGQPIRAELGAVADPGTGLLLGGAEAGVAARTARDLQIFNSDQGSQFTSDKFTGELEAQGIAVSMDGRGRCLDNIFIERLWRSLKYEEVYSRDYRLVPEAQAGIGRWFQFYNHERPHQGLRYRTPAGVYLA
jgi:transposase InsO family protein